MAPSMGNVLDRSIPTPLAAWSVIAQAKGKDMSYAEAIETYGIRVPHVRQPARGICGQLSDEGYTCNRPLLHSARCHATLMHRNRRYVVAVWPAW